MVAEVSKLQQNDSVLTFGRVKGNRITSVYRNTSIPRPYYLAYTSVSWHVHVRIRTRPIVHVRIMTRPPPNYFCNMSMSPLYHVRITSAPYSFCITSILHYFCDVTVSRPYYVLLTTVSRPYHVKNQINITFSSRPYFGAERPSLKAS